MKRHQKSALIADLTREIADVSHIYFADVSNMKVSQVGVLRRMCHEQGVHCRVVKNTFIRKALEAQDSKKVDALPKEVFTGSTALFLEKENASLCAKLIQDFRKREGADLTTFKAAYIDQDVFYGEDQLDVLAKLRSKQELIADVLVLLQSPAVQVLSALQGAGQKFDGILKALKTRSTDL